MSQVTPEAITIILAKHSAWLRDEPDGQRADLSHADLSHADLSRADLHGQEYRAAVALVDAMTAIKKAEVLT